METKLEYMKRNLKELEEGYRALATQAECVATSLNLGTDDGDPGPFEIITALRQQVRLGEEYTKPFVPVQQPKTGWCAEHSTNFVGQCNVGEHRRKL